MTEFTFTCINKRTGYVQTLVYVNKTERGAKARCTKALNSLFGDAKGFTITVEVTG